MRVRFALSSMLLLLLGSYGIGQEITATILGTVRDTSGAVIAGAAIVVVNTDTAIILRRLTTSRSGEYVVPLLPIGHYNISAEAPGFETSLEAGIELNVNDRRSVNFILQVHGLSNEIKVEAEPLQVDLQGATAAGLVSGTQVRELAIAIGRVAAGCLLRSCVRSALCGRQWFEWRHQFRIFLNKRCTRQSEQLDTGWRRQCRPRFEPHAADFSQHRFHCGIQGPARQLRC
jgi:hypothetical protein